MPPHTGSLFQRGDVLTLEIYDELNEITGFLVNLLDNAKQQVERQRKPPLEDLNLF